MNAARFSSIVVDFGLVHVRRVHTRCTRRRRVSTRAHTPTTESARNPLSCETCPDYRRGPSLSLSRFSRGSAHPSVHHPGCRRVTAPPERYAPRLQHRRTPRQHKYREIKAQPPARPPIAAVAAQPPSLFWQI